MAPEWEMGMGMEFGVGMGMGGAANNAPAFPVAASPAYLYGLPSSDTLRIDDLLDFSNHELFPSAADPHLLPPPDSSSAGGGGGGRPFDGESGSSSNNRQQFAAFPDDLYIPSEEAAELEWLSKFVEESFSDVPYPSSGVVSGAHIRPDPSAAIASRGARSKRSRGPSSSSAAAAAAAWSSLAPPHPTRTSSSSTSSSSSSDFPSSNSERKKGGPSAVAAAAEGGLGVEGGVRRCTHCASEKTPQWRTGPLGPKTLCNACGVRYKSGRLVPEYRPAASPTFVLTQHSNSHRKVMELRRQKEIHLLRRDAAGSAAAASSSSGARGEMLFHDYEVC